MQSARVTPRMAAASRWGSRRFARSLDNRRHKRIPNQEGRNQLPPHRTGFLTELRWRKAGAQALDVVAELDPGLYQFRQTPLLLVTNLVPEKGDPPKINPDSRPFALFYHLPLVLCSGLWRDDRDL
jgi:hypothetical protein